MPGRAEVQPIERDALTLAALDFGLTVIHSHVRRSRWNGQVDNESRLTPEGCNQPSVPVLDFYASVRRDHPDETRGSADCELREIHNRHVLILLRWLRDDSEARTQVSYPAI